jgi:lambda repressor-like predicted transcriptional regulator
MDWIRETVIARAEELGHNSAAVAAATGIEYSTVNRYLTRGSHLNSRYLSILCTFLELEVSCKPRKKTKSK